MKRLALSVAMAAAVLLAGGTYTTSALADGPMVTKAPPAAAVSPWPAPAIAPLAFAPPTDPCGSVYDFFIGTKCELTWYGVRGYGTVDAGVSYQTKGVPFNGTFSVGSEYLVQKNSNRALWTLGPNGLSQSTVGVQAFEPFAPGWAFVFDLSAGFDPYSFQFANGIGSIFQNAGVPLAAQNANADSSRGGQWFNNTGYVGVSSPTYGTLTLFRQWSLTQDMVVAYDPLSASYAFSLIGFSGTTCGDGTTEDCRFSTSAKYRNQIGPVRIGALWQFGGYAQNNASNGAGQGELGIDIPHVGPGSLSLDAAYSYVKDAVSMAVNTGVASLPMTATISNDQSFMVAGRYVVGPLRLYAGFEWIEYMNPSDSPTSFTNIAGICQGAPCLNNTTISTTAYSKGSKTLDVAWVGAKYTVIKNVDLIGAYYHYTQPLFSATGASVCTTGAQAGCFGTEDVGSIVIDWQFLPKWDTYLGTMFSQVNGGLSSGYLARNNLSTTGGVRFRF